LFDDGFWWLDLGFDIFAHFSGSLSLHVLLLEMQIRVFPKRYIHGSVEDLLYCFVKIGL